MDGHELATAAAAEWAVECVQVMDYYAARRQTIEVVAAEDLNYGDAVVVGPYGAHPACMTRGWAIRDESDRIAAITRDMCK
jgi:hypothetical protein